MYANVRGMKSKITSITTILEDCKPELFLITETQLRSNVGVNIPGYTFHGKIREGKVGGGVGILVRNDVRQKTSVHRATRNIELIWISVRRSKKRPIMIGTYYGKQLSRTNKEDIEREMTLLEEEITEMNREGEILLAMDGNAKLNLLGEGICRNGTLLNKVIDRTNLKLLNGSNKCEGTITRKNTKKEKEISAIDFVLASEMAEKWITNVVIDEEELYKVRGKPDTDHNTILIKIRVPNIDKLKIKKITKWNIRAPSEKWADFSDKLRLNLEKATDDITDPTIPFEIRYKKWYDRIEQIARQTIGKTTIKDKRHSKPTDEMKHLKEQKKSLKNEIQSEKNHDEKEKLKTKYREIQDKLLDCTVSQKTDEITRKFETLMEDKSRTLYWQATRQASRDPTLESLVVKNNAGERQFDPEGIKNTTADYFESLFKKIPVPPHPYHLEIESKMISYSQDMQYDELDYNQPPTREEIKTIIEEKKNNKSTSDIPNEMIKRPGDAMVDYMVPLIHTSWNDGTIAKIWNKGKITHMHKGKGDKEDLHNHRGITTSSAIGTTMDALIDKRLEKLINFSQAQGGGKKGASPCDHLFLTHAIIDISIAQKKPTFLTFWDVSKAYDHIDNNDLLTVMWDEGLKGRVWRILKELNTNLTAEVKTRFGLTREFEMEWGGKQGSRLTGRMFAKLMDLLHDELKTKGFEINEDFLIAVLLWVDDVLSFAVGETEQREILQVIAEFAVKHKIMWGQEKCKVMRVGYHKNKPEGYKWKVGDLTIQETTSYKYLGDIITSDGKFRETINSRKIKMQVTTILINSIAAAEVLNRMETRVLLDLHEKKSISGLINNSECWNLNKGDEQELEKTEVQALKYMFDLPVHIPTVAIIYSFGLLFTKQRVDQKILLYLHKILNRGEDYWQEKTLLTLKTLNLGWFKKIENLLTDYNLPENLNDIKRLSAGEWRYKVKFSIEKRNKERIEEECYKTLNDIKTPKSKTKTIIDKLKQANYKRQPETEFLKMTKKETKAIMTARYGMLECGINYKGKLESECQSCGVTDDESHRLNRCARWEGNNLVGKEEQVDFQDVYSNNIDTLRKIMPHIQTLWNVKNAHGTMQVEL